MEGGRRSKRQGNIKDFVKQVELVRGGNADMSENSVQGEQMEGDVASHPHADFQDIIKEIHSLKAEFKTEFATFKKDITQEMKDEFDSFKKDINTKLAETANELASHETRLEEAEKRLEEMERWNLAAKDALIQSLQQQRNIQTKLADLEGRSRRNNIRIFGLKEGSEGNSVLQCVEDLLRAELSLPPDSALNIQRAHRALVPKPGPEKPPRSVVVNFLQFSTKEMVLKAAWKKKVVHQDKQLFFDHDYAADVVQKRKEYAGIKKALKERGIRFQTPLTRIRIHWESGARTYDSGRAAAEELRRRGIQVEVPQRSGESTMLEERLQNALGWQRSNTENL